MANVLTTRPIVIDTAMAQDFLTAIGAVAGLGRQPCNFRHHWKCCMGSLYEALRFEFFFQRSKKQR
jgi:hypothetical protein